MATSIEQAVYRAVYTTWNAEVQATAVEVQLAGGKNPSSLKYLTAREAEECVVMNDQGLMKDWPVWVAQTLVDPLYKNDLNYLRPHVLDSMHTIWSTSNILQGQAHISSPKEHYDLL